MKSTPTALFRWNGAVVVSDLLMVMTLLTVTAGSWP